MATPLPQLISEIEKVYGAISGYANDLGSYLFNPSSNPLPQFDENQLTVDQLLEMIRNNKESAVDTAAGAMTTTIYKAAGVARELGTRSMTKAMLYEAAIDQAAQETEEARGVSGKRVAELRSMTPAQSEGI
jgi:hypothetical protein